jgi:hypothetical protein
MEVAAAAPDARLLKAHGSVADAARNERRESGMEGMAESYLFACVQSKRKKILTAESAKKGRGERKEKPRGSRLRGRGRDERRLRENF